MNNTVYSALDTWLETIKKAKSKNTWKTYGTAAQAFRRSIKRNKPLSSLSVQDYEDFITELKRTSPKTEKHHATVIFLFYKYLSAKELHRVNMDSISYMRSNETRKVPRRLRKVDMDSLSEVVEKVVSLKHGGDVITARAIAIVIFMMESGLRASEACGLKTENLDARKMMGTVIGKGDKEAHFLLNETMLKALKMYHTLREEKSDWLFISHSRRHAKTPHPIDTDTARRDVIRICKMILSDEPQFPITPHAFRHYFVTKVYLETNDIREAQEAARHDNIDTTNRYIHDEEGIRRIASKMNKKGLAK